MSVDINTIKRKLLIKYPTFGSVIANLKFEECKDIDTAGTNGKIILYNPNFLKKLSDKQTTFLFAHEVCHVAFEHIFRSEGKDKYLWNIATDAVINALLKQDGLPIIEGGIDVQEAVNYDAEEMYNKLLKEKKKQQEQRNSQGNQEQQNSQGNQEQQNSQDNQEQPNSQGNQGESNAQEQNDVGHDTHSMWDKAIEERKHKQQEVKEQIEARTNEFSKKGEKEIFKQNKKERRKQLQELGKELAAQSSHGAGAGIQREGTKLFDIGIAKPLIDWRRLLRQAIKYDEEWTRKNARMRNDYFKHKVTEVPIPETEIVLDTSGSVNETLLRNFLKECKNILTHSKVKVGCFNSEFHGFSELRKVEDIDNMSFPLGGGTDFNVAVEAFSKKASNKIIFTDGEAEMPQKTVRNVIWVVFGEEPIKPIGGKVIYITNEQLRKLYNDNELYR